MDEKLHKELVELLQKGYDKHLLPLYEDMYFRIKGKKYVYPCNCNKQSIYNNLKLMLS